MKFTKGHIPWNTGKKWSIELREKISKANQGRIPWNLGTAGLIGKNINWKGTTQERFWSKIKKGKDNECWEALNVSPGHRYAYIYKAGSRKATLAHRFSYEIHYGAIPKGMEVCHACDNTKCVNPKHLWIGTHKENMQDCKVKNRKNTSYGENHHNAKLRNSDAKTIRIMYSNKKISYSQIAKQYGVSKRTIMLIVQNKIYKA